jgi:hypothetical protein
MTSFPQAFLNAVRSGLSVPMTLEYLGLEAGPGPAADQEKIEEQAEQAVEQGQEHDLASSQAQLLAQISYRSQFPHPTRSCGW